MNQSTRTCDILLRDVRYLDASMNIQEAACLVIDAGKIVHVGECEGWQSKHQLKGRGFLWMPGFVDGHTHTSQQLLRGRLLDEKPVIWKRINVPFESQLNERSSKLSAELCALDMMRSGTTGFIDAGGKYVETFASVYAEAGLRGRLSYMTNDNPMMPESLRVNVEEGLKRQVRLHQNLVASGGILEAVFSVTALTAASEAMIRTIFGYAKDHGIATEVHMNEYASEVYDFIEQYGCRPFEWMEQENLIGERFTAAHGIFLSPEEIDIIVDKKVRVMHCPFSNCGKGIPQTPYLLNRGAYVGFGTDGSAHGGVDLFREMRLFRGIMNAKHAVETGNPQVLPAETILKMATQGGAKGLDVPHLGVLEQGAPADMIAIKTDSPHLFPTQNLIHSLVESASGQDVHHMIVNGEILMKNREIITLDEEQILHDAQAFVESGDFYWS
ncbi:MAG: amidohydrolase family protein [Sphaerochaetaceae bacterium]|nr:amidohydrolase family protein [Sphaerochaetaceae bacterium]